MPSLILMKAPDGSSAGQAFPLNADKMVLGREDGCDIVIPNNAVSRKHATISRSNGQYVLEDLKSRNRTFVNNKEISTPHTLKNEDRIKICDFLYRFYDETAAPAARPERRPVPSHMLPQQAEEEEDTGAQSTIEHTMPQRTQAQLLDTQPTDRLRVLLEISSTLSGTLDLNALLNQIAEKVLGVFRQADRCFIIMPEDGDKLIARVVKARRSAPGDDHRFSRTIVRRCMNSKESYLSEDASSDAALGAAQSIAEFRIRSVMCVPLLSPDGSAIGAIQLDTQDRAKKFKQDDLQLLTIVANLAAVAVDKARLHETMLLQQKQQKEIELAQKVQLDFLPKTLPQPAGYEFYAFYSAALTVGGDYYDFINLPDGRVACVLGDVAGKGVPAALLMAKLSAEAKAALITQPDPAAAINSLNESLIIGGIGDRFVTLALALLDPVKHELVVVNAGHINPVLYRAADQYFEDIISNADSGIPLGIMSGFEYTAATHRFNPGDNLLIFTDGVTDAMAPNGDMFQIDGIKAALVGESVLGSPGRPKGIGERVVQEVRKHANGRAQNDDIALVCFGRLEAGMSPATNTKGHQNLMPDTVRANVRDTPARDTNR
jgi:phosphoserine phosphatase RsbU/P